MLSMVTGTENPLRQYSAGVLRWLSRSGMPPKVELLKLQHGHESPGKFTTMQDLVQQFWKGS